MSDPCRWSRITSLWSARNGGHSQRRGKRQPWRERRLFPQQQIVSHMAPCRGRRLGTMWDPRLNLGMARGPVSLFCYQSRDMAAIAHMSSWRRPPPTPKTQPLLYRRLANWREAYQSSLDQILLQNKQPCEAFLWDGGRSKPL